MNKRISTICATCILIVQSEVADCCAAALITLIQLLLMHRSDASRVLVFGRAVPIWSTLGHRFKRGAMLPLVLIFLAQLGRLWITLRMYIISILMAACAMIRGLVLELLGHFHVVNPFFHRATLVVHVGSRAPIEALVGGIAVLVFVCGGGPGLLALNDLLRGAPVDVLETLVGTLASLEHLLVLLVGMHRLEVVVKTSRCRLILIHVVSLAWRVEAMQVAHVSDVRFPRRGRLHLAAGGVRDIVLRIGNGLRWLQS